MTFSQFVSAEFVSSHFLSSLNTSDASISKYSLSLKSILREAWLALFGILHIHNLHGPFPNDWHDFFLKFTNASVKSIHFTILLQDFRFCFCLDDLFVLQELISRASSRSENLKKVSSFPRLAIGQFLLLFLVKTVVKHIPHLFIIQIRFRRGSRNALS